MCVGTQSWTEGICYFVDTVYIYHSKIKDINVMVVVVVVVVVVNSGNALKCFESLVVGHLVLSLQKSLELAMWQPSVAHII